MNIHKFLEQFNKEYAFLYDHNDNVAGYEEAVKAFDNEMVKQHPEFVKEFVRFRGDFISSDREAASFMFAFNAMLGGF